MILILCILMVWITMGTATYRRLGWYKMNTAVLEKHSSCNKRTYQWTERESYDRTGAYVKCRRCSHYKINIDESDSSYYSNHWKKCGKCNHSDEELQRELLSGVALKAFALWPGYLTAYAYINASKAFLNHKGDDWSFFIQPKMVKTAQEKYDELVTRTAESEANLLELEEKIKELQS